MAFSLKEGTASHIWISLEEVMMHCLLVEQTIAVTSLKGMLCFMKLALNLGKTRNLISNYRYCSFLKEKL